MPEPEGELFHAAWEPRALALTLAMGAHRQLEHRHEPRARETLPDYARLSYYQIWIAALEKLLAERGLVLPDELAAGRALHPPAPVARVLQRRRRARGAGQGLAHRARRRCAGALRSVGDRVRTRARTRDAPHAPAGLRAGKRGVIESVHGVHVFADAHAQGLGEQPQWLYTRGLQRPRAVGRRRRRRACSVSLDAWEAYLEPLAE